MNEWFRWLTVPAALVVAGVCAPVVLATGEPDPSGIPAGDGLVVERVVLGASDADGVEIAVHYWLVDVAKLPGHPVKTTLLMDEETSRGVMLHKLQALATPIPRSEIESTPPARLVFRDDQQVIRPGRPVSIAVAGLVRRHVLPEAGPGYTRTAAGDPRAEAERRRRASLPDGASLEILEAKLGGEGGLLQVSFKTTGVPELSADGEFTYVLDPRTGERFDILRVPRLGLMAPKRLGEYSAGSYIVVRNPGGKIRRGDRITVVVEGLRQDALVE